MHIFSIIIPHHNIPDLLQRCLDSIPDVPDVQVIVVDDNSSADKVDFDHFPGLERRYTECIFDKEGGGAGHARNIGLRHADGKWLVFADSDDFFTKDAFDIFSSHKEDVANIILFKANSVDSDDYSPSDRHIELNKYIDSVVSGDMSMTQGLLAKPVPWCKMFRRDYIQGYKILFDETMASNDVMFVARSVCWTESTYLAVCTETVYTVTSRADSLMGRSKSDPDNFLCRLEVYIRYNNFLKDYPGLRREPLIILLFRSHRYGLRTFVRTFMLLLRKHALFSGFDTFMRIINNHTLRLKV